jgi:hypothetical protein
MQVLLTTIVACATDESDKVKEVQLIDQIEADASRAALVARMEQGGEKGMNSWPQHS